MPALTAKLAPPWIPPPSPRAHGEPAPGNPPARAVGRRELAVYVAIAAAMAAVRLAALGGPQLLNDSYQHLSVASNLVQRRAIDTSIVHFDTELSRGSVPAPETTFPPGFSVAIAAAAAAGAPSAWAGAALTLLAGLLSVLLLHACARAVDLPPVAARAALVFWAFSSQVAEFSTLVATDMPFTALVLGALLLLLLDARRQEPDGRRPLAALALAAAAFWVRYAGLFFIAAFHLYGAAQAVRQPRRRGIWIGALLACDALVAPLLLRNVVVAGTWMGGNSRPVRHGLASLAVRLGGASYSLLVGEVPRPRPLYFTIADAAAVAAACAVVALAVRARLRAPATGRAGTSAQRALLVLCIAVYLAGLCYLGLTSQISLAARMLLPLVPPALLLLGMAVPASTGEARGRARWLGPALAGCALAYVAANAPAAARVRELPPHRKVAEALALPTARGEPLEAWIASSVPRDAILVAVEGQATGHVLGRRTISMAEPAFTDLSWDERELRGVMARFGATYLLVYPEVVAPGGRQAFRSPLLRELAAGGAPPAWLELAAENPRALVFRFRG